jgi:NitT/TauT family transport system permease protein
MNEYFKLRGNLSSYQNTTIGILGFILIVVIWHAIIKIGDISSSILPGPIEVVLAFGDLAKNDLAKNLSYSIVLNLSGYIEAMIFAIPIGFIIGNLPIADAAFSKYVVAIRFIPLTACTGLFIVWFGIHDLMKIQFLAFGIFVYLLPTVVQRVKEFDEVYVQTGRTLGATEWQIVKKIMLPAVLSKLSDDIKVLVAISWTYIIVAELVNNTGGIGSMAFIASRQSRTDEVFGILIIIMLIGALQDILFKLLDRWLFPHKYQSI